MTRARSALLPLGLLLAGFITVTANIMPDPAYDLTAENVRASLGRNASRVEGYFTFHAGEEDIPDTHRSKHVDVATFLFPVLVPTNWVTGTQSFARIGMTADIVWSNSTRPLQVSLLAVENAACYERLRIPDVEGSQAFWFTLTYDRFLPPPDFGIHLKYVQPYYEVGGQKRFAYIPLLSPDVKPSSDYQITLKVPSNVTAIVRSKHAALPMWVGNEYRFWPANEEPIVVSVQDAK